jgi:hypothetical protein
MLSNEIMDANAILIESYDSTILNKIWDGSSFEDAPVVPFYCYAVLNDDRFVIDLIESDEEIADSTHIEIDYLDQSLRGKYYDGTEFVEYVPPIQEISTVDPRVFLSRFTRGEISNILNLCSTVPAVNEVYEYWTRIAQSIDVDQPQTATDIQTLVTEGAILSSREVALLSHFWWDPSTGEFVDPPVEV